MPQMLDDVRYGARGLVRKPLFSLTVIGTLALAIGANTVIFSFTNILLLQPLPMRQAERVVFVWGVEPKQGVSRGPASLPDLLDLREQTTVFEELAASERRSYSLTGAGDPVRVTALRATANFLETWGVRTIFGRGFGRDDDRPGAPPIVLLSHRFWSGHFGADPDVTGRSLMLDGQPFTIAGVVEPDIELGTLRLIDIWTPLPLHPEGWPRDRRTLSVTGRLLPGATLERADAEVRTVAGRLQEDHPATNTGWSTRVVALREGMTGGDTWVILALLSLVVAFVLAIACANVANLMLARALDRRREMAVRLALGAGRWQLVRQLLVEGLLLSIAGAATGVLLAGAGLRVIRAVTYEPFFEQVVIDPTVFGFALALACGAPLVFGLVPALRASRAGFGEALKEGGTRSFGGVRARRGRGLLVVTQVTLALVLLVLSVLSVRTAIALGRIELGFRIDGRLALRVDLPEAKYPEAPHQYAFTERFLTRLEQLPAVERAGALSRLPLFSREVTTPVTIEGRPVPAPQDQPWAVRAAATPGALDTLGVPLVQGRPLSRVDDAGAAPVALIDLDMARRHWPDAGQALGSRIKLADETTPGPWLEIVGIVGDVANSDIDAPRQPHVYVPMAQHSERSLAVVLQTASKPAALAAAVRTALRETDPDLAAYELRTLRQAFHEDQAGTRLTAGLFTAFAIVALLLAAAGLYGVMSYSVSRRSGEMGLRLALGAEPAHLLRLVLGEGLRLVAAGLAIGLVGSFLLAQALGGILYGVSPREPSTYLGVALLLAAVAALAGYVPARRAMRADPTLALRAE
jgi:putative ABC transport system permease protein